MDARTVRTTVSGENQAIARFTTDLGGLQTVGDIQSDVTVLRTTIRPVPLAKGSLDRSPRSRSTLSAGCHRGLTHRAAGGTVLTQHRQARQEDGRKTSAPSASSRNSHKQLVRRGAAAAASVCVLNSRRRLPPRKRRRPVPAP
jgi:hypothetical protein